MTTWYRSGTIGVTNGQVAVVGAGTDWAAAKVQQGDSIYLPDGRPYEVQSVNSATSITLTTPYLGATGAGAAYFVVPVAVAARLIDLSTQAATLVQQFSDVAQAAGVGKFFPGLLVGNLLRPSLRGVADDDTGVNLPGGNVVELVQGGVKALTLAPDSTPSGPVVDKWPKAAKWSTPRSINGTAVDGSQDVKISEWRHSDRDFNAGVLVRTDLPYIDEGVPWVLEVRGNSYGQLIPLRLDVQGYMYNGSCINTGAVSTGAPFPDVYVVRLDDGTIGFWWGRVEYWQGFSVRVYVANLGYPVNRAIHVSDIAKPVSVPAAKEVRVTPVQAAFRGSDAKFAVLESTVGIRQGPLAPLTAKKLIQGTMPTEAPGQLVVAHGLDPSKIVSLQAEVRYDAFNGGSYVGPNSDGPTLPATHFRFRVYRTPGVVAVAVDPGEGVLLLGQLVNIWLEYIVN